jgi:hypothetical protein
MKALPTTSATSLKMIIEDSEREGEGVGGLWETATVLTSVWEGQHEQIERGMKLLLLVCCFFAERKRIMTIDTRVHIFYTAFACMPYGREIERSCEIYFSCSWLLHRRSVW